MRIIILHGDDERKLYLRLQKFIETAKSRSWEVNYLDDSPITESLSASSLFGNERFFIVRNIKLLGKKEIEWLGKKYADLSGTLIIYNEGYIGKTILSALPKDNKNGHTVVIEEYKLPVLIWNFLENIHLGGGMSSVKEFHKIIGSEAPEFIFTLIAKLFRDLYWAKVDPSSMPYPPWRVSKLKAQSSKFTESLLTDFLDSLARIDVDVKTGKADLVSALDLLILKQLE